MKSVSYRSIIGSMLVLAIMISCEARKNPPQPATQAQAQTAVPVAAGTQSTQVAALVPQKTCPIMGGAITTSLFVDHNGKRIYVCCKGCLDAVRKNPQQCIDKLAAQGESVISVPAQ
jgi:hypothetical protein